LNFKDFRWSSTNFVEVFNSFINIKRKSKHYSCLDKRITYIIVNTLHKIEKPKNQKLFFSGRYKTHGITTQLLINYDDYVVAYSTNIPGKVQDSLVAL